ncbi:MAG: T9SS type A sorting domain-containing protein, partial [Bacteroidales bacterium]
DFVVNNINIPGPVVIKIKPSGTTGTQQQITIDNISWTSYSLPIVQDVCGNKLDWSDVSDVSDYDGCSGTITYTYTYKDCADLEYLWSFTYNLNDDQAPVLIGEVPEGETDMNLCFADIPAGPELGEIVALYEDNCGGTVTVTKTTDLIGTDCSWVVTYTYTAADECGNTAAPVVVVYSGGDTEKPVWDQTMPADITVSCDQVPEVPEITASDNCDDDVLVSFNETREDGACAYNYTLTRTWEAEDNCGNKISHVQVITVQDTDAPSLRVGVTLPEGETDKNLCFAAIPEGPTAAEIAELFEDNCSEVIVVKYDESVGDDCSWIVTYTYTISDECGNTAQPVVVVYSGGDTEAPELVGTLPGETGIMSCVIAVPEPTIKEIADQFSDNCGNVNVVKLDEQFAGDACAWAATYTYTVSDDCGNYYADPVVIAYSGSYPLPALKDEDEDCSSLNKVSLNWNVGYAEQFQPADLEEQVKDLYLDPCGGVITVTHIHTEKDHHNGSGPVQWNFYYTYRIVNSCGGFVDCTVHYAGSPTNVPPTINIDDKIVESGQEMCFGATETIEVSNLTVEAGGVITLIAGQSIKMLPGVVVKPGGYLHAYISDTYCENPTPLIMAKDAEETSSEISAEIPEEYTLFNVYPNPTRGSFTLDVYDFDSDLTIEIYNMVGTRILSKEVSGFSKYTFDLSTQPNGIYIIRVLKDNESAFKRIIKQ